MSVRAGCTCLLLTSHIAHAVEILIEVPFYLFFRSLRICFEAHRTRRRQGTKQSVTTPKEQTYRNRHAKDASAD